MCRTTLLLSLTVSALAILTSALAAPSGQKEDALADEESLIFAKLLGPVRELAERAGALEILLEKAAQGDDAAFTELAKRQGAWDMDYGWGGGRFGKRGHGKRYDMYGMSGRFGRDVSRDTARNPRHDANSEQ